ncbi:FIST N-terminal domain-containing protein [Egicoccus halophilus]|uniref:FIST N-terminal domain-containing protein n=1 Tax=Egicoccus halophilus TaxID=1670830 RepID=UPI0013EE852D|nr:FIST N-terminal domain-containing protein [Egicoccus halophilus]
MRTAASLSRTPEGALAAAEAADAVGADLGDACDLAVVFVRPEQFASLEAAALAVETRLEPGVLVGAVAAGVVGPGAEVESGPGVVVWGARLPSGTPQPFRSWSLRTPTGGMAVAGWPDTRPGDVVLLLADPLSYPAAEVVLRTTADGDGAVVVGGLVTGGAGRSRLVLDGTVHEDGAVGVVLRGVGARALVSQGCRPIGAPLTVTTVERNRILALGGEPAARRLEQVLHELDDDERRLLERGGLQIGLVAEEVRDTYAVGDFLVRGVLAIDPESGGITVGDLPRVGQTVQFQVRDPSTAEEDLASTLAHGGPALGSLLFTCTGRGRSLFGVADHDVRAVELALGGPVAGAVCAGQFGPAGRGRSSLHGYAASVLTFPQPDPRGPSGA